MDTVWILYGYCVDIVCTCRNTQTYTDTNIINDARLYELYDVPGIDGMNKGHPFENVSVLGWQMPAEKLEAWGYY